MRHAYFAIAMSGLTASASLPAGGAQSPTAVAVRLSEWRVEVSTNRVPTGPTVFAVTNGGSIPHAFEVEGRGLERSTRLLQPGHTDTLTLTLRAGTYQLYCPVGGDSHKHLGMLARLVVGGSGVAPSPPVAGPRPPAAQAVTSRGIEVCRRRPGRADPPRALPVRRQRHRRHRRPPGRSADRPSPQSRKLDRRASGPGDAGPGSATVRRAGRGPVRELGALHRSAALRASDIDHLGARAFSLLRAASSRAFAG